MFNKIALYLKDARGGIRVWEISARFNSKQGYGAIVDWNYGTLGGALQSQSEYIDYGLAGRNLQEQVNLFVNSKISSKMDRGYVKSLEDAKNNKVTNALGLEKPMLAVTYKNIKDKLPDELWMQNKYNGHRCLIKIEDGNIFAYSRNGKEIDTIPEIFAQICVDYFDGLTLDGELYHHGTKLQTISSWVKRRQEATKNLTFICYDVIMEESFSKRFEFLKRYDLNISNLNRDYFEIAQTWKINRDRISDYLNKSCEEGYEGLILRQDGFPYSDGKRSKSVIKVKKILDDEFLVKDIIPAKEGWGILCCIAKNGRQFTVSAPGSMEEKQIVMDRKESYIGKFVRVEYAELTKIGIPFHPVAIMWRDKQQE